VILDDGHISQLDEFFYIYEEGEHGNLRPAQITIHKKGFMKTEMWNGMIMKSFICARAVLIAHGDPEKHYFVSKVPYS
jgi:hypothetical protein